MRNYLIPGFFLGLLVGYILQNVYPVFLIWEFERYTALRHVLGAPETSYTQINGVILRLYFHLLHAFVGGAVGFLIFHFRYRYVGYIVPLSKSTRILVSILAFLLLFFFIRIDLFDQVLASQQKAIAQTIDTVSFLRSLFAPPTVVIDNAEQTDEEDIQEVATPEVNQEGKLDDETEGIFRPPEQMGTPRQIYDALNSYRRAKGLLTLVWDNKLANFAQSRASTFATQGGDDHRGFDEFLQKQNGFAILGFDDVAENSAYLLGSQASGERIITEYFAESKEHNANQLEATFTHVGIGVSGISVDIVFGGQKRK